MNQEITVTPEEIDELYERLHREAEAGGYHLNPDREFTRELLKGLLVNVKRYGYQACPCRLASGNKDDDLDIICPCDYRDPDIGVYGSCYCGLYVSEVIVQGKKTVSSIPDRRPSTEKRGKTAQRANPLIPSSLPLPVWRCKVCGYLCAREEPPETCPVCKVKKDRFERFM